MLINKKPMERLGKDRYPMILEEDIETAEKMYETFCALPVTYFEIKLGNLYFAYGKSQYYDYDVLRFETNAFDEFDFDEDDYDQHPEDFIIEFVPKDGKFYEPDFLDHGCPEDWNASNRVFDTFHDCIEYLKTFLRKHGSLEESNIRNEGLEALHLSSRAYNGLYRAGYDTVADVADATYLEISKVRNIGKGTLAEIVEALKKHGIELREESK